MIILGIDPGTATVGFGIIQYQKKKRKLKVLDFGVIETKSNFSNQERLKKLYLETRKLLRKWKPKALAIERLYFFKNLKTGLPVSEAKGVILLSAAQKKIPVFEFTPLQVKMAIVGYGRAKKEQVQRMVKFLLNLKELPKPDDAADALSVAICCARIFEKN